MENLNEYLQTLVSTRSFELHLEPNKPPYTISENGTSELANAALLGTQISTMIFPIIPSETKQQLPNQREVEFVYPHNLGSFNFLVKKSPAGFNVTIRPHNLDTNEPQSNSPISENIPTPPTNFPMAENEPITPTISAFSNGFSNELH
jgi:hypothetical protein